MFKPAVAAPDDHPLLRAVANWPGRGPTQLAFEARGFGLHRVWQDRMIEFCGEQQSHLLNRYWDEIARETMQCLGKGDPDQRKFVIEPKDRSSFLDKLSSARDFLEPKYPSPPLIKGLFEYQKRVLQDGEFAASESSVFEKLNTAESERLSVDATGWSGKKRDVTAFLDQFCSSLGFERRSDRWQKRTRQGLVFGARVDLGGQPHCITVPLIFRIHHFKDAKLALEITGSAVFDRFIPGFYLYRHGQTAGGWVLGIKAYIELFDVVASSLAQA